MPSSILVPEELELTSPLPCTYLLWNFRSVAHTFHLMIQENTPSFYICSP